MRNKGFTLVELLIVISIIAVLTTMVTMSLLTAKGKAKIQITRALIAKIQSGLEGYYAAYGDYPPTTLSDMYSGGFAGNNGIESVVYCLSNQDKGGPFLLGVMESDYSNLDSDQFGNVPLREISDGWKAPIVYFHSRDYDNPSKGNSYSFRKTGVAIMPQFNPALPGTYYNQITFQLWSAGPDEKNNNGLGDDVNNWE
ncbi:MAG: type II secretion system protein [Planctomycetota bacterium]